MQPMRDLIRGALARGLRTLEEEDRLAAALPLVCGSALASHCTVAEIDEGRVLHLQVDNDDWLHPLLGMRERLLFDLRRVAGVPLSGLHFREAGSAPDRPLRSPSPDERAQAVPGRQRLARPFTPQPSPRRPA